VVVGEEMTVVPAPEALSVLAAGTAVPQQGAKKGAAKNTAGATKKNIASESAPPTNNGARKTKGSKRPADRRYELVR
jgi:hypothetical protein